MIISDYSAFKKILNFLVSIFLSFFFLCLILSGEKYKLNIDIRSINFALLIPALLALFLGFLFKIYRWFFILNKFNPELVIKKCISPYFISMASNNLLPFRFGDVFRVLAFNSHLKVNASVSILTLLTERALDLFSLIFLFLVISLAGGFWSIYLKPFKILFILFFISALIFLYLNKILIYFKKFTILPSLKFRKLAKEFFIYFKKINKYRNMLLFLSVIGWFFEGLFFYFIALSFSNLSNPSSSWLAFSFGSLSSLIPSLPGFVGTFDYFVLRAMSLTGNLESEALTYTIFLHFLLWFTPVIFGIYYFCKISNKIKFIKRYVKI
jgi:uncharacterized protein (TIRG00374 family)